MMYTIQHNVFPSAVFLQMIFRDDPSDKTQPPQHRPLFVPGMTQFPQGIFVDLKPTAITEVRTGTYHQLQLTPGKENFGNATGYSDTDPWYHNTTTSAPKNFARRHKSRKTSLAPKNSAAKPPRCADILYRGNIVCLVALANLTRPRLGGFGGWARRLQRRARRLRRIRGGSRIRARTTRGERAKGKKGKAGEGAAPANTTARAAARAAQRAARAVVLAFLVLLLRALLQILILLLLLVLA